MDSPLAEPSPRVKHEILPATLPEHSHHTHIAIMACAIQVNRCMACALRQALAIACCVQWSNLPPFTLVSSLTE